MKAVVMAGGFGTRIQPLTHSRPKPMLPIMNKPMMEHTMMTLRDLGIKDFIVIKYIGDDKVLLPVENLDSIDRYIAGGGTTPVLDRLGKGSFAKLKDKVKKRLFEIAGDIVNTAATRALIKACP